MTSILPIKQTEHCDLPSVDAVFIKSTTINGVELKETYCELFYEIETDFNPMYGEDEEFVAIRYIKLEDGRTFNANDFDNKFLGYLETEASNFHY